MQIMLRYTENIINAHIVGWIGQAIGDWSRPIQDRSFAFYYDLDPSRVNDQGEGKSIIQR